MPVQRYTTPLRYPGGKSKLANFMKLLFRLNRLEDGEYVEPYAGGAAVALALLYEEYASHIHINDLDPAVHAFWHSVLHKTDALCQLVQDTPVTAEEWQRQRAIYAKGLRAGRLPLGFAAFFLNRTNRSGIIGSGGMIGGTEQTGPWSIDARYNKAELRQRIEKVASYAGRISLYNEDAATLLQRVAAMLPKRSLTYLDPPYYVKGARRLYANYYKDADHAALARVVAKLGGHWVVSYDAAPRILELYGKYRRTIYGLRYTAQDRYDGREAMFFSPSLTLPQLDDPCGVTRQMLVLSKRPWQMEAFPTQGYSIG